MENMTIELTATATIGQLVEIEQRTKVLEVVNPRHNYSVKEACLLLNISRKKLDNYRSGGYIQSYIRKVDGSVRIKGSEILKFYNS